jgi:hypothetical protein
VEQYGWLSFYSTIAFSHSLSAGGWWPITVTAQCTILYISFLEDTKQQCEWIRLTECGTIWLVKLLFHYSLLTFIVSQWLVTTAVTAQCTMLYVTFLEDTKQQGEWIRPTQYGTIWLVKLLFHYSLLTFIVSRWLVTLTVTGQCTITMCRLCHKYKWQGGWIRPTQYGPIWLIESLLHYSAPTLVVSRWLVTTMVI